MAEPGPGKETAPTPPPLPQETLLQGSLLPVATGPATEPSLEGVSPFSASQDTETAAGGAATLDSALPEAESSAHRPPPQETAAVASVATLEQTTREAEAQPPVATMAQKGAELPSPPAETPAEESAPPEQTTTEAGGQPPVATMPQKVAPLLSPPAETPAQESAAPAAPTPPSPPPPPPQKQEGGVPELASPVHEEEEEEKDASKAREKEGQDKSARRRWRCLRAAVCLLFLRPKSGETKPPTQPGDKQPASGLEEKKPTPQKDSGSAVRVPSKPEAAGKGEGETRPTLPPPPAETPSSQERTATATPEAEKQLAAPAPQQPPRKQEDGVPEEVEQALSVQEKKDAAPAPAAAGPQEGEEKPARRRWRWLQAAVGLLFLRPSTGGETKPVVAGLEDKKPTPGEMPPLPVDSTAKPEMEKQGESKMEPSAQDGKRPATTSGQEEKKKNRKDSGGAASKEKDEGEESKGRRDEIEGEGGEHPLLKKLRKAGRLVQRLMSLYNKHRRSQGQERKPEKASGPGGEEDSSEAKPEDKQSPSVPEEAEKKTQPHRNWPREEVRLEHILEDAFTRLLAAEYNKELSGVRQKCLLTFSVFELASEVKKQAMIYWWVAEFNLRHRSDPPPAPPAGGGGGRSDSPAAPQGKGADSRDDDAEGIYFMLSDHGFLVPMKNWCSKVIHGCQVNPLVHWMLKRQARADRFAELDDKGCPADSQPDSSILCLTAGNRPVLQKMRVEDESQSLPQQASKKEPSLQGKGKGSRGQDQQQPKTSNSMAAANKTPSQKDDDTTQVKEGQLTQGPKNMQPRSEDEVPPSFEGKRVILNVNAHVYPISKYAFLNLAECLVVLQLGRWNNLDDRTYMEVEGLDTRNAIGLLKNLRYLGLRGLSRLTELPKGIESLKKLVILDMRGCQNLVKVAARVIAQLKQLTHLDLTECYMLEHIGRGITSLTELQVFKGFVFATGTQGKTACRIQDLRRLKKLQKLSISITTDANVGKGEMAELKNLTSLRKLTITWSEIPSILEGETEKVKTKRRDLIEKWTSFQLPKDLMKLDIRCYPKEVLELEKHDKLKKLYLRGGDMERFSTRESSTIKTLRLRYLKKFKMEWKDIRSELQNIEYVEIVANDKHDVTKDIEQEVKDVMKIPDFTLDGHGVWMKDDKEEQHNGMDKEVQDNNNASGPSGPEDSSTKTASTMTNVNKNGDKAATEEQADKEERAQTKAL